MLLVPAGCGSLERPPAAAAPSSAQQLERLVVPGVPSGLPRLPDWQLQPPAGAKSAADVAGYAGDPAREREVLAGYGYRFGWERFWGDGGVAQTSVFLDQFRHAAGARRYANDLAHNDATHYRATWRGGSGGLPAGCRLITAARDASAALPGPAAFAWCAHGVFAVAVTAVAGSSGAAVREVSSVVRSQLARLPG
jgi:hypothetical protein